MHESDIRSLPVTRISEPVAGVLAGLVAGAAYLIAQISLTAALRGGGAAEPLQRIAAILMGPNAAPPPTEFTFTVLGMALIIHFGLAMVFGRIVSVAVWHHSTSRGVLIGAAIGLALYAINFGLLAPSAFPWFEDSIRAVTIADHLLFGSVAAAVCLTIRGLSRGA